MRIGFLLLVLASLALAIPLGEAHLGRTIPLHIPTQTVTVNDTFEVPSWLGAFYATAEVSSVWTLPLTIGNGGQTYPGEFLIIRNYGPADITLLSQAPETIEGASSYLIPSGTVAEILSGYPNWVVTNLPNFTNQSASCWASVGTSNPANKQCGDLTVTRLFSDSESVVPSGDMRAITFTGPTGTISTGTQLGYFFAAVSNNTGVSSALLIGGRVRLIIGGRGVTRTSTTTAFNVQAMYQGPYTQTGGNALGASFENWFNPEIAGNFTFSGMLAGSVSRPATGSGNGYGGSIIADTMIGSVAYRGLVSTGGGMSIILTSGGGGYDVEAQTYTSSPINWGYRYTAQTGAVKNVGVWGNSNTASSAAGWCTGTAADTCKFRGRAGAWTNDDGTDEYTTGFYCAGPGCTSSAPSAASVGLYDSGIRTVRSCTAGAGITCSVTDGVLTVAASIDLKAENESLKKRLELLESQMAKLLQLSHL